MPDVSTAAGAVAYVLSVPAIIALVAALAGTGYLPGRWRRIASVAIGMLLGALVTFVSHQFDPTALASGAIVGLALGILASLTVDTVKGQRA